MKQTDQEYTKANNKEANLFHLLPCALNVDAYPDMSFVTGKSGLPETISAPEYPDIPDTTQRTIKATTDPSDSARSSPKSMRSDQQKTRDASSSINKEINVPCKMPENIIKKLEYYCLSESGEIYNYIDLSKKSSYSRKPENDSMKSEQLRYDFKVKYQAPFTKQASKSLNTEKPFPDKKDLDNSDTKKRKNDFTNAKVTNFKHHNEIYKTIIIILIIFLQYRSRVPDSFSKFVRSEDGFPRSRSASSRSDSRLQRLNRRSGKSMTELARSKIESARSKNESVRSKNGSARSENESVRSKNGSARLNNGSGRLKMESARSKIELARSKIESARSKIESARLRNDSTKWRHGLPTSRSKFLRSRNGSLASKGGLVASKGRLVLLKNGLIASKNGLVASKSGSVASMSGFVASTSVYVITRSGRPGSRHQSSAHNRKLPDSFNSKNESPRYRRRSSKTRSGSQICKSMLTIIFSQPASHKCNPVIDKFWPTSPLNKALSTLYTLESQKLEYFLGLQFKFDSDRHMPWRHNLQAYLLTLPPVPEDLYMFMNFEVFRLSSFGPRRFPKDVSHHVTYLAKSGFYFRRQDVQIVCFGCENRLTFESLPIYVDNTHLPHCTRLATNKSLDYSLLGLNVESLTEFVLQNGSTMTYLLDGTVPELSGTQDCEAASPDITDLILTSSSPTPMVFGISSRSSNTARSQHRIGASIEVAHGGYGYILHLDSISYPHFFSEDVRRRSFANWNPHHSHRPEDLAGDGFFYAGYADCVRCYCCGLGLKFWRPGDIPAYQHAQYRPHCRFNILLKGQDYIDRVQRELQSNQPQEIVQATPTQTQEIVQATPTQLQEIVQATPTQPQGILQAASTQAEENTFVGAALIALLESSGTSPTELPENAKTTMVSQSTVGENFGKPESFTDTPIPSNHPAEPNENLPSTESTGSVDSGIFSNDKLQTTLPSESNLRVNNVIVSDSDEGETENNLELQYEPAGASNAEQREGRVPLQVELLRVVEKENSLLEARITCQSCLSRPVGSIYLPCGHVIACQGCADASTHCMQCKQIVYATASVYLA